MQNIEAPAHSFQYKKGQITIDGRNIGGEDKFVLFWHPKSPEQGAGFQAGRCAECGSAGCFQGCDSDSIGCPFERNIPDIHDNIARANTILEKAVTTLRRLDPHTLAAIENDALEISETEDLGLKRARLPLRIFEALAKHNAPAAAQFKADFNHYMKKAFDTSYQSGPMGDIYGRICPETLCKATCTTHLSGHGAITIPMNEVAVWDYAWESGFLEPIKPTHERPETVLIVGSGFAGYAAAERARENGYNVVVVEKNPEPGEPGHTQILNYKVAFDRTRRHWDRLRESNVTLIENTAVGEDETFLLTLVDCFDAAAVVLATGAPFAKMPTLTGNAADQVIGWNSATGSQQSIERDQLTNADIPEDFNAKDKKVLIIGTGDTAVDCARAAITQGAKEIVFISRRDEIKAESEDKKAFDTMLLRAEQANIPFSVKCWMDPKDLSKNEEGGYILKGTNKNPDHRGTVELHGDMVVAAMGSDVGNLRETFEITNLPLDNDRTLAGVYPPEKIATKSHLMKHGASFLGKLNEVYVFAAGQIVRGAGKNSLAAVNGRDGVDVAKWLDKALQNPELFDRDIERVTHNPPLVLIHTPQT